MLKRIDRKKYDAIDQAILENSKEVFKTTHIDGAGYILEKMLSGARKEAYLFGETLGHLFYSNHLNGAMHFLGKTKVPVKIRTEQRNIKFEKAVESMPDIDYKTLREPLNSLWKNLILIDDKMVYIDQGTWINRYHFEIDAIFCPNMRKKGILAKLLESQELSMSEIKDFKKRVEDSVYVE